MGRKNIFSLFKIGNRRRKPSFSLFPKRRRKSIFGRSRRSSNPFNSLIRFIEAIAKLLNVFKKYKK